MFEIPVGTCERCGNDAPVVMFMDKVTCMTCRAGMLKKDDLAPAKPRKGTYRVKWNGQDWITKYGNSLEEVRETLRREMGRKRLPRGFEIAQA